MRAQSLVRSIRTRASLPLLLAIVASLPFACHSAGPEPAATGGSTLVAPPLGAAGGFAVLGGTAVTNTGATVVLGVEAGLGVAPGSTVTGFPPGRAEEIDADNSAAIQGQADATTAYAALASAPCTSDLSGRDLGGLTLTPGVYCFSGDARLTGTLTLDAQGDFNALFVFQIGGMLAMAANASVQYVNYASFCQVYWQVGDSAAIGVQVDAGGTLLAQNSITIDNGATFSGRVLARNGAVSLDTDTISLPLHLDLECSGFYVDAGSTAESGSADAGPDGSATESGGGGNDAGTDGTMVDSGAGMDGGVAETGAPDAGGTETGSGGDAGQALCCGGVLCGASCTNLSGDVANCGACGHACPSDQFCAAGACVTCASVCAGACVDLGSDGANCGACGHACAAGQSCTGGACVACASVCQGACVDLGSDGANCGSCGNACAAGESCKSGACVACAQVCWGACVDLATDPTNCGACGTSCAPGESCKSGSCVCQ